MTTSFVQKVCDSDSAPLGFRRPRTVVPPKLNLRQRCRPIRGCKWGQTFLATQASIPTRRDRTSQSATSGSLKFNYVA